MATSASAIALKLQKLSNEATKTTLKYNKDEANTARTWQKMMSDTSHQREVADLKKAGLNPVLSVNDGAQSYTTTAASGQAENAAPAVGQIYGAEMSAQATKQAAATSAAAMKAAAAQQAAAARYAASLQYQASVYHSDKALEAQKYRAKMDYKIALEKPQGSPFAVADKYFSKYQVDKSIIRSAANMAKEASLKWFKYDEGTKQINKNNFQLSNKGDHIATLGLKKLNVPINGLNKRLYFRAFVFHDSSAMKVLSNKSNFSLKRKNSAATNVINRKSLLW